MCGKKFHPSLKERHFDERAGYFDIETSQAGRGAGNFGIVYGYAIKDGRSDDVYYDIIRERTLKEERRVLVSMIDSLRKFDVLYTWYGTGHDFPVSRTRCVKHGLDYPEYMELYHTDLYYVFRRLFNIHSNRLESAAKFLGVEGKTPLDPEVWVDASFGSKQAFRYIRDHNIGDVLVLEAVEKAIRPFYKGTRRSI